MNGLKRCNWCGRWFDPRVSQWVTHGNDDYCCEECRKKEEELDDKIATQWGAL